MTRVSLAALIAGARSGNWLVSFPTDTVPAIAVRPDRTELVFTAKQRSPNKPLIIMGATPAALWPFAKGSAAEWQAWQQVAQQHWPGALTLVLPASNSVPDGINSGQPSTIGLRVPDAVVAQTILQQTGPLATTSANLSGNPPLQSLAEIELQFPDVLTPLPTDWTPWQLDSTKSKLAAGVPSTVAKWTQMGWQILRQGAVELKI
ncbi:MAG TPA: L-threonylcarbamoyladenylate synthase [Candidatus Caenarcaniphilales bacterium]